MKFFSYAPNDHRGQLLARYGGLQWHRLASGFQVGVRSIGDAGVQGKTGHLMVLDPEGNEWINFGQYRFRFSSGPPSLDVVEAPLPIALSSDGNYLALTWSYFHHHGAAVPVVINLPSRTYTLVEPRRILTVEAMSVVRRVPVVTCTETVLGDLTKREKGGVKITVRDKFRPVEEFYDLDPFSIDTWVYSWPAGKLSTRLLKNCPRKIAVDESQAPAWWSGLSLYFTGQAPRRPSRMKPR